MIQIKQYATCLGCRALTSGARGCLQCGLHYETKVTNSINDIPLSYGPAEPCPKPTTFNGLMECERRYKKVK